MKKKMKHFFAIALSIAVIVCFMPQMGTQAFAEEQYQIGFGENYDHEITLSIGETAKIEFSDNIDELSLESGSENNRFIRIDKINGDYVVTAKAATPEGYLTFSVAPIVDDQFIISAMTDLTVHVQHISIEDADVVLSADAFKYNGQVQKPEIITIGGEELVPGDDYIKDYSNYSSKDVGSYTVTATGKGNYTGVAKATYQIYPKGTSLKNLAKAKGAITVKWYRQKNKMSKTRITGYQIQLATDSEFTQNVKNAYAKGYKKYYKKVKNLKHKKLYYVKIRTYKTVNGTKIYSDWSKAQSVKTK